MRDTIEVWTTKYALTNGIEKIIAELCDGSMVKETGAAWSRYFHGNEWHTTREAALKRAEEMRIKKIAALEKQIAAYRKLRFE